MGAVSNPTQCCGVRVPCCQNITVPTTLTLTITCPVPCNYAGVFVLEYGTYAGVPGWYSPGFAEGAPNRVGIRCEEMIGWYLYAPPTGVSNSNADGATCEPFELSWSILQFSTCPDGINCEATAVG
jgi:hypothetical protein